MDKERGERLASSAVGIYISFVEREETHAARLHHLIRKLLEINNEGLDTLFEHKTALAEVGLLADLVEPFRRQNKALEELSEYARSLAESRAELGDDIRPIVRSLCGDEEIHDEILV